MELISVIIPVFNKEATIGRAIESVLNQDFSEFELLIVDDGSTDRSLDVINSIQDNRIRIIRKENGGVSSARNMGIRNARCEYVTFLDADDEWDSDFLSSVIKLTVLFPEAKAYATNYRLKDYKGSEYATVINGIAFGNGMIGVIDNYFHIASISSPPVCSISILTRKVDIERINGFPEGIKSGEDLLTWARLIGSGTLAYDLEAHATYNLGEGYEYSSRPVRRQDPDDPVGKALLKLYHSQRDIIGLREYISHWHKMRASVAIRFGEKLETIKECALALKYNPKNHKVMPFIILACTPAFIRQRIIAMKHH